MRVLVTGASGCVGRAVTAALLERGHGVVAAQRGSDRMRRLFPQVETRPFDLTEDGPLDALVRGVDALVHLAAIAHAAPRSPGEVARMMRANAETSLRLARAAAAGGVRTLLYASSVAVYGAGSAPGDAPSPDTPYGESKLAGERPFLAEGGMVLRLSLVFGPGDRGNVALLARQIRRWGGVVLNRGLNVKSLVYARHVGDRIAKILEEPGALAGAPFDVVDYSPTQAELVTTLASVLGRRPPPSVPLRPFQLAGTAVDVALSTLGRPARWRRRVDKLAEDTRFDGAKLDARLDFAVPRTLRAALAETFEASS